MFIVDINFASYLNKIDRHATETNETNSFKWTSHKISMFSPG